MKIQSRGGLEGTMIFEDGDYLIKNQTGECYVCKKEIFEKTYREVVEND